MQCPSSHFFSAPDWTGIGRFTRFLSSAPPQLCSLIAIPTPQQPAPPGGFNEFRDRFTAESDGFPEFHAADRRAPNGVRVLAHPKLRTCSAVGLPSLTVSWWSTSSIIALDESGPAFGMIAGNIQSEILLGRRADLRLWPSLLLVRLLPVA
jgi:hypothetical protein